ncbi:hypothetical protein [Citrobacter youngae]|uniref:hypothetical protein n=1 Tax=Citrobacter youngae TaxID=133448 RepID=UPI0018675ECF|nr:hypothetical protein [Citrobacter youngae]
MKHDIVKVGYEWVKLYESDLFIIFRVVCNLETSNNQISNASHIFTMYKSDESRKENRAEQEALRNAAEQIDLKLE